MSQPYSQPSFLALPTSSHPSPNPNPNSNATSSASTPRGLHLPTGSGSGTTTPRKRKLDGGGKSGPNKAKFRSKSGVNDSRELDERDDVTEDQMEDLQGGGGAGMRETEDNYDEGDGEEEEGAEVEVDIPGDNTNTGIVGKAGMGGRSAAKKGPAAKMDIDVDGVKARAQVMKGDQMALRSTLSPEDAKRFDAFSSGVMPPKAMKKLLKDLYDQNLPDRSKLPHYLAGMAKIFVAEVVEIAKDIQPRSEHPTGPLKPYHLRLARQVLEERGVLGASTSRETAVFRPKKPLFKR